MASKMCQYCNGRGTIACSRCDGSGTVAGNVNR